eukprot:8674432-Pyramimonas_sp.AAC.1
MGLYDPNLALDTPTIRCGTGRVTSLEAPRIPSTSTLKMRHGRTASSKGSQHRANMRQDDPR